jgi:hypothetical protein
MQINIIVRMEISCQGVQQTKAKRKQAKCYEICIHNNL